MRKQPITAPISFYAYRGLAGILLLLTALCLISGCTSSRLYNAVAPSVAVSDVAIDHVSFVEQALTVALKISNPNAFALPISGIDYTVEINGEQVADGATAKSFTLPANGTKIVRVNLVGDFINALSMFKRWRKSGSKRLNYRVSGTVELAGVPIGLPFTYADSVSVGLP